MCTCWLGLDTWTTRLGLGEDHDFCQVKHVSTQTWVSWEEIQPTWPPPDVDFSGRLCSYTGGLHVDLKLESYNYSLKFWASDKSCHIWRGGSENGLQKQWANSHTCVSMLTFLLLHQTQSTAKTEGKTMQQSMNKVDFDPVVTQWSFGDFTRLILSYSPVHTLFMCFVNLINVSVLSVLPNASCVDMAIKYLILNLLNMNIFATSRDNQSISWDFFYPKMKISS